MRILVTGGLGVNGAMVVEQLLTGGHHVTVFDASEDTSLLGPARDSVAIHCGDIRDPAAVDSIVAAGRIETIIHLAALLTVAAEANPALALDVNVLGMRNVMSTAVNHDVGRVVFASSKAIYGPLRCSHGAPSYRPVSEDHPFQPNNFYDYTKAMCEGIGRKFAQRSGLEFAALRFGTIFGPGRSVRHQSRLQHSALIEAAIAGAPFTATTPGRDRDDIVYVGDVADALVGAASAERLTHPAYNISRGALESLHSLRDAVLEVIPDARLEVNDEESESLAYSCVFDCDRARTDFGFNPASALSESVRQYIDHVRRG